MDHRPKIIGGLNNRQDIIYIAADYLIELTNATATTYYSENTSLNRAQFVTNLGLGRD